MSKINKREWSETELKVIKAVNKYPAIYKRNLGKKPVRRDCWKAITKETGLPEEFCKRTWKLIRNSYIRAKRENHASSKFLDSNLKFIASEVDISRKSKFKRKKTIVESASTTSKKENVRNLRKAKGTPTDISTIKTENATDEDDDSSEDDEVIVKRLVSEDPTELLDSEIISERTFNIQSVDQTLSSSDESMESVEFKIDIIESYPMVSSQEMDETKPKVDGSQPVNYNITNKPRKAVHSIKFEEPEMTDIQINSNDIFKLESIKSEPIDIPTDDVGCEPILTPRIEAPTENNLIDTPSEFSNVNVKSESMSLQTENPPVLPCKDIKQFFSVLSRYISKKFSTEKQEDLQLDICSLLTSEELEGFKQMMQSYEM